MDDDDLDNIYTIEKDTDQFDNMNNMDNHTNSTSIALKVNNIGSLEKKCSFSFEFCFSRQKKKILSQKFNQLSTTTVTKEQSTILKDMKKNLAQIPDYLIQRNKSFEKMIYQILSTITITVYKSDHDHKIEAWTKTAIIIYKIMIIETYHRPWTTYLKSGMRQLIIPYQTEQFYSTTVPICPKQIKL
jgi:hypothetical protein